MNVFTKRSVETMCCHKVYWEPDPSSNNGIYPIIQIYPYSQGKEALCLHFIMHERSEIPDSIFIHHQTQTIE